MVFVDTRAVPRADSSAKQRRRERIVERADGISLRKFLDNLSPSSHTMQALSLACQRLSALSTVASSSSFNENLGKWGFRLTFLTVLSSKALPPEEMMLIAVFRAVIGTLVNRIFDRFHHRCDIIRISRKKEKKLSQSQHGVSH
jgi:hypothetical protein